MTDEFRYAFRAAGWVPNDKRGFRWRLTLRDHAVLPDAELISIGTEIARARNLNDGFISVGIWTNISQYVEPPEFIAVIPGTLDDKIEDTAEMALQRVLRRHFDDELHHTERPLVDAAHWAALGVMYDLSSRAGFELLQGNEQEPQGGLDDNVRKEIVSVLAANIRRATNRS